MTTLAEHLDAARLRAVAVQRELDQVRTSQVPVAESPAPCLRIKLVETERLIAILSDPDIADGYQKGRSDCARHLRTEFGLDRPDDTPVLNLMRRLADLWDRRA